MVLAALVSVRLLHPLGMSYSSERFAKADKSLIIHVLLAHNDNKVLVSRARGLL